MAELKTRETEASVKDFIDAIDDEGRRADCRELAELMAAATGDPGAMWGASIVGFGRYRYRYESGREGQWFQVGFSPRKQALTLYIMDGFARREALMRKLGKHKTGKSCLYIKRLDDVDRGVLEELLGASVRHLRDKYPDPD